MAQTESQFYSPWLFGCAISCAEPLHPVSLFSRLLLVFCFRLFLNSRRFSLLFVYLFLTRMYLQGVDTLHNAVY